VLTSQFSPCLSLVSSHHRRRLVLALAVTRVVVVLSSCLSLVPLLVLLVAAHPYLEPLPVLPTTVALSLGARGHLSGGYIEDTL